MQAGVPLQGVHDELARVLARAEFTQRESLLQQFLEWLAPRMDGERLDVLADVFLALFGAVAVVLLVALVRRSWRSFRVPEEEREPTAEAGPPAHERLRQLVAAARAARLAGDLRGALRLCLHALLVALGGRGDLELRAAWTNRELLRRGRPSREARALLEPLVRELEPKEFGRASVEPEDVARLEALLAAHLVRGER